MTALELGIEQNVVTGGSSTELGTALANLAGKCIKTVEGIKNIAAGNVLVLALSLVMLTGCGGDLSGVFETPELFRTTAILRVGDPFCEGTIDYIDANKGVVIVEFPDGSVRVYQEGAKYCGPGKEKFIGPQGLNLVGGFNGEKAIEIVSYEPIPKE